MATGGKAKRLDVPGADLGGVVTLRTHADARMILDRLAGVPQVVIVGSSFIGLECAASLVSRGLEVTVVSPEPVPFAKLWGEAVGAGIAHAHRAKGVRFLAERQVTGFLGEGTVEAVLTDRDERLPAGLVIVGIGIAPATGLLRALPLDEDGGVPVDASLRAAEDLYVAGDIARVRGQGTP